MSDPIPDEILERAWDVLIKQEKRREKQPDMHPERFRYNLAKAIAAALLAERERERERCAKLADDMSWDYVGENGGAACDHVARAIRGGTPNG